MKTTMKQSGLIALLISVLPFGSAFAQINPKTTGFGMRGSYWNMRHHAPAVHVYNSPEGELIDLSGAGGWLYFFSRTGDSWFLELHLGGIADVIERHEDFESRTSRVLAVVPVLVGLRHPLLSPHSPSALRPYIACGAGPYWIADILVQERYYDEEVSINSTLRPGAYAGGGLEFMLSSNFGLSFDIKHHFVDFNVHNEHSGYEYAVGLQFYWGDYKPGRSN